MNRIRKVLCEGRARLGRVATGAKRSLERPDPSFCNPFATRKKKSEGRAQNDSEKAFEGKNSSVPFRDVGLHIFPIDRVEFVFSVRGIAFQKKTIQRSAIDQTGNLNRFFGSVSRKHRAA